MIAITGIIAFAGLLIAAFKVIAGEKKELRVMTLAEEQQFEIKR